ncbi:hypothetical protein CU098_001386, partial [Rhizopus stolonifer]
MAGPTRKQQNSNSTARPTFMKQLLFLVLPNSKQNQQEKQEQQNRIDNASSNGYSLAKKFAEKGCLVVATARRVEALEGLE